MLCLQFPIPQTINMNNMCTGRSRIFEKPRTNDLVKYCKPNSCLLKFRLAGRSKCAAAGSDDKEKHQIQLPQGLAPELMPKHVAVIMDGNRRWATNRGYPVQVGHRAGGEALKRLSLSCRKFGVEVLTVFAFSTENWIRPKEEVEYLMKLFEENMRPRINLIERNNNDIGRLTVMGNKSQLPESLQNLISTAEEVAKDKRGPHIVLACNYSGRYDITEATKKIATKVKDGILQVEDIDENLFEQHLGTNGVEFPNPDLMIRTSGELRLSNFMLWQLAHTQLFFSNKMFPDFDEADFVEAIAAFQRSRSTKTLRCF